jgi:hypothetical protein
VALPVLIGQPDRSPLTGELERVVAELEAGRPVSGSAERDAGQVRGGDRQLRLRQAGRDDPDALGPPAVGFPVPRAPHLLYFLIKDHPFSDGNKRIGTLLFLEYRRRNGMLVCADGAFRLADNTMVALALLIVESEPKQKDLMIRLILNLLEDGR